MINGWLLFLFLVVAGSLCVFFTVSFVKMFISIIRSYKIVKTTEVNGDLMRETFTLRRIAIVGVEGSGKTVMLAGLADLYSRPDDKGRSQGGDSTFSGG